MAHFENFRHVKVNQHLPAFFLACIPCCSLQEAARPKKRRQESIYHET